jgi:hypothetical protein
MCISFLNFIWTNIFHWDSGLENDLHFGQKEFL